MQLMLFTDPMLCFSLKSCILLGIINQQSLNKLENAHREMNTQFTIL